MLQSVVLKSAFYRPVSIVQSHRLLRSELHFNQFSHSRLVSQHEKKSGDDTNPTPKDQKPSEAGPKTQTDWKSAEIAKLKAQAVHGVEVPTSRAAKAPLIDWIFVDHETSATPLGPMRSPKTKPASVKLATPELPTPPPTESSSSPVQPYSEPRHDTISIDTSGLFKAHDHADSESDPANEGGMNRYLKNSIKMRGPMSIATYMRECLTNPKFGYYMKRDVFGQQGDFITSPEISQMFGELLAVWCIDEWQKMGEPNLVHLVEFGPGRGTLMKDVLRVAKKFPRFHSALSVHFIEVSPHLRTLQAAAVGVDPPSDKLHPQGSLLTTFDESRVRKSDGLPVHWHPLFKSVPEGPTLVLAQEFFDALPIHRFEFTPKGWREILVDINVDKSTSPFDFRYVLAPGPTPAAAILTKNFSTARVGSRLEICPDAPVVVDDIAARLRKHGGGALLIDYGEDKPLEDSLRAIKNHKFVDVFDSPGEADLSALVDYGALRSAATKHVPAYGSIAQGEFLQNMGIETRLAALLKSANDDQAKKLISSYERLISPKEMGATYKVLGLAQLKRGAKAVGFESL